MAHSGITEPKDHLEATSDFSCHCVSTADSGRSTAPALGNRPPPLSSPESYTTRRDNRTMLHFMPLSALTAEQPCCPGSAVSARVTEQGHEPSPTGCSEHSGRAGLHLWCHRWGAGAPGLAYHNVYAHVHMHTWCLVFQPALTTFLFAVFLGGGATPAFPSQTPTCPPSSLGRQRSC